MACESVIDHVHIHTRMYHLFLTLYSEIMLYKRITNVVKQAPMKVLLFWESLNLFMKVQRQINATAHPTLRKPMMNPSITNCWFDCGWKKTI
mmetsp:Transcript_22526/g.29477  ORF Transcript_22526/g.29477 Transcript_22526/m.29477 type:complete len:92 (+) Transcript_22526:192-467(+)